MMKKVVLLFVSLITFSSLVSPVWAEESNSVEGEDLTTKSDRIVKESFVLQPNANVSQRTNFTILDEDVSKKIILELWVERKEDMEKAAAEGERRRLNSAPAEGGESSMIYQLNGVIYLLN